MSSLNLGSSASRRAGSIPVIRTLLKSRCNSGFYCLFAVLKKSTKTASEYLTEYPNSNNFTISLEKKRYHNPALYIPTEIKNGKKVPSVKPGKRWYVYFKYDGKTYKFYKDLNYFKTVRERKRVGKVLVTAYTEMLRRGWSPVDKKYKNSTHKVPTIEKGLLNALELKKLTIEESTYNQYSTAYYRFIEWCKSQMIAGLPADQLQKKQFAAYLNYLKKEGNNKTSIGNNKRSISALYSKMVNDYIIENNPITGITTEKSDPLKNRPFTVDQLKSVITYCSENDPLLLDYIKFIVYALLRPREITRIKPSSIEGDLLFLKTKKLHATIKIIDKLKPVVNKYLDLSTHKDDTLITKTGTPFLWKTAHEKSKTDFFTRRFKKVKKALDLSDDYGLYSLRHTSIFLLYQSYLKEGMKHNDIISNILPITRHKSYKELSAYLREVGAQLPDDYGERFDFDL